MTRSLATHGALRLEVDFLDVFVAADGTPYVSLVDGCTAEECHSRLGQGIVGHLVSGPPLVRTVQGRGLLAPIRLVRLARGRLGVMIVARTSTGGTVVHTRRYRTCARRALSTVTGGASISS